MFRKLSRAMENMRKIPFKLSEVNSMVSKRKSTLDTIIWVIWIWIICLIANCTL